MSRLASKRSHLGNSFGLAAVSRRNRTYATHDRALRATSVHLVVESWSFVGGVVSVKVSSRVFLSTSRCKWRVPHRRMTRGRDCLPERYANTFLFFQRREDPWKICNEIQDNERHRSKDIRNLSLSN